MELSLHFSQDKRYKHHFVRLNKPFDRLVDQKSIILVSKPRGYSIYFADDCSEERILNPRFHAVNNSTGFVDMTVDGKVTTRRNSTTFEINTLEGRSGSKIKAHEFYRSILINMPIIFVSEYQSYGGMRTWQELSRYRDIEVFGWSNGRAINVDPMDQEETHAAREDICPGTKYYDREAEKIMKMKLVAHERLR